MSEELDTQQGNQRIGALSLDRYVFVTQGLTIGSGRIEAPILHQRSTLPLSEGNKAHRVVDARENPRLWGMTACEPNT